MDQLKKAALSDTLMKMLGTRVYVHVTEYDTETYIVDGKLILVSTQLNVWTYYLLEDDKALLSCFSFAIQQVTEIMHNVVFIG